ncbi:hypothetical protein CEXT_659501 [Caerostris extrusa]|uniref:Uncharacterized protein n=1 Tax=Caerostris extrusa TaxID=172846 RepID=A0AAV4PIU6_CAEEX|nr:hypothetical protein CEXT_659501 [Caerostris extrusa]
MKLLATSNFSVSRPKIIKQKVLDSIVIYHFSSKDNQTESVRFYIDLSVSTTDESSNSNDDVVSLKENKEQNETFGNNELLSFSPKDNQVEREQLCEEIRMGKDESCSSFSNKSDISDHEDVSDVFVAKNIAGDDYEDILTEEEDDSEERKELFNELVHNNDVKESTSTKSTQNKNQYY